MGLMTFVACWVPTEWETGAPIGAQRTVPPACYSVSVIQRSAYIHIYIYSDVFLLTEIIGVWFDSAVRSRIFQGVVLHHQMQAINQWTLMPYFRLCGVSSPLRHIQSNSVITL